MRKTLDYRTTGLSEAHCSRCWIVGTRAADVRHPINTMSFFDRSILITGDDEGDIKVNWGCFMLVYACRKQRIHCWYACWQLWDVRARAVPVMRAHFTEAGDFISDMTSKVDTFHLLATRYSVLDCFI